MDKIRIPALLARLSDPAMLPWLRRLYPSTRSRIVRSLGNSYYEDIVRPPRFAWAPAALWHQGLSNLLLTTPIPDAVRLYHEGVMERVLADMTGEPSGSAPHLHWYRGLSLTTLHEAYPLLTPAARGDAVRSAVHLLATHYGLPSPELHLFDTDSLEYTNRAGLQARAAALYQRGTLRVAVRQPFLEVMNTLAHEMVHHAQDMGRTGHLGREVALFRWLEKQGWTVGGDANAELSHREPAWQAYARYHYMPHEHIAHLTGNYLMDNLAMHADPSYRPPSGMAARRFPLSLRQLPENIVPRSNGYLAQDIVRSWAGLHEPVLSGKIIMPARGAPFLAIVQEELDLARMLGFTHGQLQLSLNAAQAIRRHGLQSWLRTILPHP